ncbi:MAG: VanZ family protein [Gammaproteobacteria bacterium]|nr:VanZ family protein [Gammaproteobacteria bacterium]
MISIPLISFTGRRLQHWLENNLGREETGWLVVALLTITGLAYSARHLGHLRRLWWRLLLLVALLLTIIHFVPITEERIHFILFGALGYLGVTLFSPIGGLLICTLFSIGDEVFQWFLPDRVGDVRDVVFNFIASGIGILLAMSEQQRT